VCLPTLPAKDDLNDAYRPNSSSAAVYRSQTFGNNAVKTRSLFRTTFYKMALFLGAAE
jgi:hypothetical protein